MQSNKDEWQHKAQHTTKRFKDKAQAYLQENKSCDEEELLRSAVKWQRKTQYATERLGNKAKAYLQDNKIRFERGSQIAMAWDALVPELLVRHCSIIEFSGGTLKVQADPGPYMYELRLISDELVGYLRKACPRSGVKKISLKARTCFKEVAVIAEAWGRLLPDTHLNSGRVDSVSGKTLKVIVKSWSDMQKLRSIGPELVERLQKECPGCGIEKLFIEIRQSIAVLGS